MSTTVKMLLAIAGAVVLSPLLIWLARRWRNEAAGFAAGGVVESGGIGPYITRLRHEVSDSSGHGDDGGADGGDGDGE